MKRKPGRPPKIKKPAWKAPAGTRVVTARLTDAEHAALEMLAAMRQQNLHRTLRSIILEAVGIEHTNTKEDTYDEETTAG